jgi:uncharacterized protein YjbI with pentapeptide repeats
MNWLIVGAIALGAGTGAAALFWGAWWAWWRLPKRQVDSLRLQIRDPKARADVEDNFRKTVGQVLGGAAVLIGAGLAYLQFSQQQQASQQQFSQQQQASRDLLISNQVAKGFEQLGSDKVVVRLGGIYALEGVMNTSEQYYRPVLEALSAFVRDGTGTEKGNGAPATEIQAALTVIGRRKAIATGTPDLAHANIPKADLSGADLSSTNLSGSNLSGADLTVAILNSANLTDADLSSTFQIHITSRIGYSRASRGGRAANLTNATLLNADLRGAHLNGVNLRAAFLIGADLTGADLTGANLNGAHLNDADLTGANLNGADLNGADLIGATVSQTQLDKACGTNVKLNSGLTLKPC